MSYGDFYSHLVAIRKTVIRESWSPDLRRFAAPSDAAPLSRARDRQGKEAHASAPHRVSRNVEGLEATMRVFVAVRKM